MIDSPGRVESDAIHSFRNEFDMFRNMLGKRIGRRGAKPTAAVNG